MRAREFLTITKVLLESDDRNKFIKLKELIEHPHTEDTIKSVARNKLEHLLLQIPENERDQYRPKRIKISTNLTEQDLDLPFSSRMTIGQVYMNLSNLRPEPNNITFLRPAQIHMFIPPPFCGISKQEYYQRILEAVPGVRKINSKYLEGSGYHFVLSFM